MVEQQQAHTFSFKMTEKPTGPLETLMPVIIQEFHTKSTFNKPFQRPQEKPSAVSINNILRETGPIPTVFPGKCLCADILTRRG